MVLPNRRSKIITLRLLEKEYADLQSLCMSEGSRSLSDLARYALRRLKERGDTDEMQARIDLLREAIHKLDRELMRLSSERENENANGAADSRGGRKVGSYTNGSFSPHSRK